MNNRILLFGGTSEGRILAEFLQKHRINFTLSVATDYGKEVALNISPSNIISGRLNPAQISDLLKEHNLVIDATHPYAEVVTENIKNACNCQQTEYIRVVRQSPPTKEHSHIRLFKDIPLAVEYLNTNNDVIFLTTGSKNLKEFTGITNYRNRVFVRILPMCDALTNTLTLGFKNSNIICMQGSFSKEMNLEMLKMTKAKYLVTKDSGNEGGFLNKIEAASILGVEPIVITCPTQEEGRSLNQVINFLKKHFVIASYKRFPLFVDLVPHQVTVIGGGKIATRRILTLLNFTPNITVISPDISAELNILVSEQKIKWIQRPFLSNDLIGAYLVLAATNNSEVNSLIANEAKSLGIFCSRSDSAFQSSCWFPGIAENDSLVAGIVSTGYEHKLVSHTLKEVRKILEQKSLEDEV